MRQPSYILDNDELQEAINKAYEYHEKCCTRSGSQMIERHLANLLKIQCERARTINLDKQLYS